MVWRSGLPQSGDLGPPIWWGDPEIQHMLCNLDVELTTFGPSRLALPQNWGPETRIWAIWDLQAADLTSLLWGSRGILAIWLCP